MNDKASTTFNPTNLYNLSSSPTTKRTDYENIKTVKRIDPSSQEGVLDLIHKMRLQMIEVRDAK